MTHEQSRVTMDTQYPTMPRAASGLLRRGGLAVVLFACVAAAMAQESGRDEFSSVDGAQRFGRGLDLGPISGFSIVELAPTGPNQRPRRALRMRMDSATRAFRSMGVDAEDCSSLLRSSFRSRSVDALGEQRANVGVSVALSCRFF